MKTGKHSVVIGNVPSNSNIGEGSVVIGATDAHGNTILNQPMAVGFGAKAGPNSIAIGAFAGAGVGVGVENVPFPDVLKNEMAELIQFAVQQQNRELLAALERLSDELKPEKPATSLVFKAWEGVKALATIDGAQNMVGRASTALLSYLSQSAA